MARRLSRPCPPPSSPLFCPFQSFPPTYHPSCILPPPHTLWSHIGNKLYSPYQIHSTPLPLCFLYLKFPSHLSDLHPTSATIKTRQGPSQTPLTSSAPQVRSSVFLIWAFVYTCYYTTCKRLSPHLDISISPILAPLSREVFTYWA